MENICDLSNEELSNRKEATYQIIFCIPSFNLDIIVARSLLKKNLDILCEIEREITLRRK